MGDANQKANKLTTALLVIYITVLFWILLFKLGVRFSYMEQRIVNLVPFKNVGRSEAVSNLIIFIPLGLYVGVLFKKWSWARKLLFIFFTSFIVEALQFVFRIGSFDITDLITNTSGGIIGLLITSVIGKITNSAIKTQKFFNVIATVGTVLIVTLLILLKMNMLPIRYQ